MSIAATRRHIEPSKGGKDLNRAARHALDDTVPFPWNRLSVDVSHDGGRATVRLAGDLDFSQADTLRAILGSILDPTVVVDLRGLTFIDSTGLSALVLARRAATDEGRSLSLFGARGLVRRVFEATEMRDVLAD